MIWMWRWWWVSLFNKTEKMQEISGRGMGIAVGGCGFGGNRKGGQVFCEIGRMSWTVSGRARRMTRIALIKWL